MEHFHAAGLNLHIGSQPVAAASEWSTTMPGGLWLACVLNGQINVEREGTGQSTWKSGSVACIWQESDVETLHRGISDTALDYVFVHVSPENLERIMGGRVSEALRANHTKTGSVFVAPKDSALSGFVRVTALQMLSPAVTGPGRACFLAGKALEIMGSVIDMAVFAERDDVMPRDRVSLSPSVLEATHHARSIIMQNLKSPPQTDVLARLVGLNSHKLNECFKAVFGQPIYGYIKGCRMQKARLLIESGETSISKVAYELGYTPGHFSTEFRKKYGVSPKAFVGGSQARLASLPRLR